MTFETFDQSDEGTGPDQQKTMTKTMTMTNTFMKHPQRATPETCDLWDIWSEWWGDQQKYNDNDKYNDKDKDKDKYI